MSDPQLLHILAMLWSLTVRWGQVLLITSYVPMTQLIDIIKISFSHFPKAQLIWEAELGTKGRHVASPVVYNGDEKLEGDEDTCNGGAMVGEGLLIQKTSMKQQVLIIVIHSLPMYSHQHPHHNLDKPTPGHISIQFDSSPSLAAFLFSLLLVPTEMLHKNSSLNPVLYHPFGCK